MKLAWVAGFCALAVALSGCRTTGRSTVGLDDPATRTSTAVASGKHTKQNGAKREYPVEQVGFLKDVSERNSESSSSSGYYFDSESGRIAASNRGAACSLVDLEQIAIASNPAVAEIVAEIESLRGKLTQAGLPPNPTFGVNGEDINEDGGAGRYGVFFGRQIVRGNKLGLSRSVVCAEIQAAEQRLAVIHQRLLTDVRQRYYDMLIAQETLATTAELVKISQDAVDVSRQLFEAKEAPQTSILQSEVELQNALVVKQQANNQLIGARRKLAALLGEADLGFDRVGGSIQDMLELSDFEQSYDELVNCSPEIAALFAEVKQRRRQLCRQIAEPIPNLTWQTTLQYDIVTDDIVTGFQFGVPIPTLNRNQGAIHQARYEIVAAERRAEKKALELRERLASAYENYLNAKLQVDAYDSQILPKAKETLDLVSQGYREGEIDFLLLLTAQRSYSQTRLAYLRQLKQMWRQNVEINGMLLSGSLASSR